MKLFEVYKPISVPVHHIRSEYEFVRAVVCEDKKEVNEFFQKCFVGCIVERIPGKREKTWIFDATGKVIMTSEFFRDAPVLKQKQFGEYIALDKDATETDIREAKRNLAQRVAEYIMENDAFIVKSPDDYVRIAESFRDIGGPLPIQWTVAVKVLL